MRIVFWGVSVLLAGVLAASAAQAQANPAAINAVLKSLQAPAATEQPVTGYSEEGYLRYLGAPPGGTFLAPGVTKSATPEAAATAFVGAYGAAFGLESPDSAVVQSRSLKLDGRSFVRFEQKYGDLPVFGAELVATVNADNALLGVLSDILRDTSLLDKGSLSLRPRVTPQAAAIAGKEKVSELNEGFPVGRLEIASGPTLVIFAPSVVGVEGPIRLAYEMNVRSTTFPSLYEKVVVDAHAGEVVLRYPLQHELLSRQIFDAENTFTVSTVPVREENGAATGITEVDDSYDQLGDVYNFFFNRFQWDSFDDQGSPMRAVVRVPFFNAYWSGNNPGSFFNNIMVFGTGFVIDDVTAHEVTHGVTEYTSDLIYRGLSGAINESMSDIFGEFIDLTNGRGDDSEEVRWRVGEDLPEEILDLINPDGDVGIRDMRDPTLFGDPDRVGSPNFIDPSNLFVDGGGVHINSGIPNKLAYLLTDGEDFNGQSVNGLGIDTVAQLFFGAQMILTPGADFEDLYFALAQMSVLLGFSLEERLNLLAAANAVEIAPRQIFGLPLNAGLRAVPVQTTAGEAAIALLWENLDEHPTDVVLVQRSTTEYPKGPSEGERIVESNINAYLDMDIVAGTRYYYTAFLSFQEGPVLQVNASAVAGEALTAFLAEPFGSGSVADPIDLSFKQITFYPTGRPQAPLNRDSATSFESYTATIAPARELPVPRSTVEGGGSTLDLSEDGFQVLYSDGAELPLFGQHYDQLVVAANGYIFFDVSAGDLREEERLTPFNFPSLASHFESPRISFLFSDLAPSIGGEIWIKNLDDRFVVTVEEMPEWQANTPTFPATNTVQVELFYSGTIRMTYLELAIDDAVVGLSDGLGVPLDPSDFFDNVVSAGGFISDLSSLPAAPQRLSLAPVAPPVGDAGDLVEFEVETIHPEGLTGPARLRAEWDRPELAPFIDNGDGTGAFRWESGVNDDGFTNVRFISTLGGQTAYQDVRISLSVNTLNPVASNVHLLSEVEGDDPTLSRTVPTESALFAQYTYSHPQLDTDFFDLQEGDTRVIWYRNNIAVPGLMNMLEVPASTTRSNDIWHFAVTPVTRNGIVGEAVSSPTVVIAGEPQLDLVAPNFGLVVGGETVRVHGSRLSGPLSVKFGGVRAQNVRSISDSELEVVTPLHEAGIFSVEVETAHGVMVLPNAFSFVTDISQALGTDINGDGRVDSVDIQLVVNAVLEKLESKMLADANGDGEVNAADIQAVVNDALRR